jgi:hypothetical protein
MNAPFGGRNWLVPWHTKFFEHGDGICLVPDRTSAPWWQIFVPRADLVLFVAQSSNFSMPAANQATHLLRGALCSALVITA